MTTREHHNDDLSARIKHPDEIMEQLRPTTIIADPVLGPTSYIRAEKWRINRVFYFLAFISVVCLCALILVRSYPSQRQ